MEQTTTNNLAYYYPSWLDAKRAEWQRLHPQRVPEQPRTARTIKIECTNRDVRVRIQGKRPPAVTRTRGNIKALSKASAQRFRLGCRGVGYTMQSCGMLSYPADFPTDGRMIERHKRALFKRIQRRNKKAKFVWVKEFQQRGALHFHFMCTEYIDKHYLARAWYEIVGSGDIKHRKAGTTVEVIRNQNGLSNYFGNYMAKQEQKRIPEAMQAVGRMWGIARSLFYFITYEFQANTKRKWDVIRTIRRAYGAALRARYGHRWKRRKPASGFLAWDGRKVFEMIRAKSQVTSLTA